MGSEEENTEREGTRSLKDYREKAEDSPSTSTFKR